MDSLGGLAASDRIEAPAARKRAKREAGARASVRLVGERERVEGLGAQIEALTQELRAISEVITSQTRQTRVVLAQSKKANKGLLGFDDRLARIERLLESGSHVGTDHLGRQLGLAAQERRRHLVEVRQPLALISQVPRSGGTLLSQLLDGHPQCHSHAYELQSVKGGWPVLRAEDGPAAWWERLREAAAERHFYDGYKKGTHDELERFPFLLAPALAEAIFAELAGTSPGTPRAILDAYMTAYFNAWLDNQNLYGPDKRWVVAFAPHAMTQAADRESFFRDYPDGRLICIVRNPKSWYASASAFNRERYGDVGTAIEAWRQSASASLAVKLERPDQVQLIRFEQLLDDTRRTMEAVTSFLGIDLTETCLVPTFNGRPIMANSSFSVKKYGVLRGPLRRGESLDRATSEAIDSQTGELYAAALAAAA